MKPIELFYLLSNVKNQDEFVKILRANRIKSCKSKPKKKLCNTTQHIESLLDKDLTATSSSVSNSTRCPCCNCVSRNIKTLI